MRNRAKCKKCGDIIESFTLLDWVECGCGQIAISGGLQALKCYAVDWASFARVDDAGGEVDVRTEDEAKKPTPITDRTKLLEEIAYRRKSAESASPQSLQAPLSGYDLVIILMLLESVLKLKD